MAQRLVRRNARISRFPDLLRVRHFRRSALLRVVEALALCHSGHAFHKNKMHDKDWKIDENSICKLFELVEEVLEEIKILKGMVHNMADATTNTLESLTARVKAQESVEDGILTMVHGLVAASGGDPVKLQALADALTGSDVKLKAMSDALIAGTVPPVVVPPAATNVLTLAPAPVQVAVGATQQIKAVDSNGIDVTSTTLFSSADLTVASCSVSGLVSGVAAGATKISATNGTEAGDVNVTVA